MNTFLGVFLLGLWLLPYIILAVGFGRAQSHQKITAGCASIFAAGAFVFFPQCIGYGTGLAISGDNMIAASLVGAVVGVGAALGVVWFLTKA